MRSSGEIIRSLGLVALLGLGLNARAEEVPDCVPLFRRLSQSVFEKADRARENWQGRGLRKEAAEFDYDRFEHARLVYRENGTSAKIPETVEEKLAFLEVASDQNLISHDLGARPQRSAFRLARRLFPKDKSGKFKPISRATLESALIEHYRTTHGVPESLRGFLTENMGQGLKRSILARVEKAIQRQGVERAFEDLGLLKEPGFREKYREFERQHDGKLSTLFSLVIDAPMIAHGQIPPVFPRSPIGEEVQIPAELLEKIRKEGLDAAYPEMRALFMDRVAGREFDRAEFDYRWNLFREVYQIGVTGWFGAVFLEKAWEKAKERWEDFRQAEEEKKDLDRQIQEYRSKDFLDHALDGRQLSKP